MRFINFSGLSTTTIGLHQRNTNEICRWELKLPATASRYQLRMLLLPPQLPQQHSPHLDMSSPRCMRLRHSSSRHHHSHRNNHSSRLHNRLLLLEISISSTTQPLGPSFQSSHITTILSLSRHPSLCRGHNRHLHLTRTPGCITFQCSRMHLSHIACLRVHKSPCHHRPLLTQRRSQLFRFLRWL